MTGRDVAGRDVVVVGVGVTGQAVAEALLDLGANVLVIDARHDERGRLAAERLRSLGAAVRLGDDESAVDADLVVASPGLRLDHPMFVRSRAAGIEVIGEPELAWQLRDPAGPAWLGVTGTNGKTTTVGMLEAILRAAGLRTVAAGNVGHPLITALRAQPSYDVLAVELSSQQLAWSPSLRFTAGALLNLAADHLDWHDDFAAYAQAKKQIWLGGVAIGNADDPIVAAALPTGGRTFSVARTDADYALIDNLLVETATGTRLVAVSELPVSGAHNYANALAAAALARAYGVDVEAVRAGLSAYAPGRHRNELVAEVDGVGYVDDSKATNAHAADASLRAYDSVVWIAGGLLKGASVDELVAKHGPRLRAVVLIGRDRAMIAEALSRHASDVPVADVSATETGAMQIAVRAAQQFARPGDTVLLAPAAASWDIFRDYAQRGELFAAAARALEPTESTESTGSTGSTG